MPVSSVAQAQAEHAASLGKVQTQFSCSHLSAGKSWVHRRACCETPHFLPKLRYSVSVSTSGIFSALTPTSAPACGGWLVLACCAWLTVDQLLVKR
jgi:hypothetical protein